jgi:hypothetical protein
MLRAGGRGLFLGARTNKLTRSGCSTSVEPATPTGGRQLSWWFHVYILQLGSRAVLPRDARTRVAVVEEDRHFGPRDAADLARVELPVRPRRYDADTDRGRLCELLLRLSQYTSVTYMRLGVSKQIFPGICGVDFQKIPGNIQGIQF